MGWFRRGRQVVEQGPALVAVPPRGGALIAEVHESRLDTLAAALIDGAALEVGRVRAVRVAVGDFLIETGYGSLLVQDAVEAVTHLLAFDQHHREYAAA